MANRRQELLSRLKNNLEYASKAAGLKVSHTDSNASAPAERASFPYDTAHASTAENTQSGLNVKTRYNEGSREYFVDGLPTHACDASNSPFTSSERSGADVIRGFDDGSSRSAPAQRHAAAEPNSNSFMQSVMSFLSPQYRTADNNYDQDHRQLREDISQVQRPPSDGYGRQEFEIESYSNVRRDVDNGRNDNSRFDVINSTSSDANRRAMHPNNNGIGTEQGRPQVSSRINFMRKPDNVPDQLFADPIKRSSDRVVESRSPPIIRNTLPLSFEKMEPSRNESIRRASSPQVSAQEQAAAAVGKSQLSNDEREQMVNAMEEMHSNVTMLEEALSNLTLMKERMLDRPADQQRQNLLQENARMQNEINSQLSALRQAAKEIADELLEDVEKLMTSQRSSADDVTGQKLYTDVVTTRQPYSDVGAHQTKYMDEGTTQKSFSDDVPRQRSYGDDFPMEQRKIPTGNSNLAPTIQRTPPRSYANDIPKQQLRAGSPKQQLRAGSPKQQLRAGSPKQQLRAGSPKQQLRAGSPKQQFRADSPKQQFRADSPKQQFRTDIPNQQLRRDIPKQQLRTENSNHPPASPESDLDDFAIEAAMQQSNMIFAAMHQQKVQQPPPAKLELQPRKTQEVRGDQRQQMDKQAVRQKDSELKLSRENSSSNNGRKSRSPVGRNAQRKRKSSQEHSSERSRLSGRDRRRRSVSNTKNKSRVKDRSRSREHSRSESTGSSSEEEKRRRTRNRSDSRTAGGRSRRNDDSKVRARSRSRSRGIRNKSRDRARSSSRGRARARSSSRGRARNRSRSQDLKKKSRERVQRKDIQVILRSESEEKAEKEKAEKLAKGVAELAAIKLKEDAERAVLEKTIALYMNATSFHDAGNVWCKKCSCILIDIPDLCKHLHSEDHLKKIDLNSDVKRLAVVEPVTEISAPTRGEEFLLPMVSFFCSLCCEFSKDRNNAEVHMKSTEHNNKFKEFLKENSGYELQFLKEKKLALLAHKEKQKDNEEKQKAIDVETSKKFQIKFTGSLKQATKKLATKTPLALVDKDDQDIQIFEEQSVVPLAKTKPAGLKMNVIPLKNTPVPLKPKQPAALYRPPPTRLAPEDTYTYQEALMKATKSSILSSHAVFSIPTEEDLHTPMIPRIYSEPGWQLSALRTPAVVPPPIAKVENKPPAWTLLTPTSLSKINQAPAVRINAVSTPKHLPRLSVQQNQSGPVANKSVPVVSHASNFVPRSK